MTTASRHRVVLHALAVVMAIVVLAPFAWLVISSISAPTDLVTRPLHLLPRHPTLSRYAQIFTTAVGGDNVAADFRVAMVNGLIVACATVAISLTVGALGGYAFARLRFRLRRVTLMTFLGVYMLPPIALVIPLYLTLSALHLLDTKLGLVLTYCSIVTPFCLWTMSNYYLALPEELEDAARVDGCSRLGALWRVVLPLSRPGLFATALFGFLLSWDEFLYALIFTSTLNSKTIPVAIAEFTGKYTSDFGLIAAGGVLAAVPPVLLALLFQRYIVGGLASGAVKG